MSLPAELPRPRTLQHSHEKSALFFLGMATVGILAYLGFVSAAVK